MSSVGTRLISGAPSALRSFVVATSAGRKSATAAAITTTSDLAALASTASAISAAVSTSTTSIPGATARSDVVTRVTSAPSSAAASARAWPWRPEERFERYRTGSMGSRVPPAVTSTRRPRSGPAPSARPSGRGEDPARGVDDRGGLGQAPCAHVPTREMARSPARARAPRGGEASPGSPAPPRAPTSRCAWQGRRAPGLAWQARLPRAGPRRSRPRTSRSPAPSPGRRGRGRPGGRARCGGSGWSSPNTSRRAGSEARAEKVAAPTKRVALAVRTGTTCAPASTSRRQSSTAL